MSKLWDRVARASVGMIGIAAVIFLVILQLSDPAPIQRVRMLAFDSFQTLSPRPAYPDASTVMVDVDETSIARIGQWPWPRTELAKLTQKLGDAGAKAIAFDIVFSEADRTSPEQIANRISGSKGSADMAAIGAQLAKLPSHDALLAQSFGSAPVVTAFFLTKDKRGRPVDPKASFTLHGSMPYDHVERYQGTLQALPPIEAAAKGNGFVSLQSDADGIVRRVPLVAIHDDMLIAALSLEAVRIADDAGSPNLLTSDGSGETLASPGAAVAVRIGDKEIPVNDAGEAWVHFPEDSTRTVIPAWSILADENAPSSLESAVQGKIVYIGGSAIGLQDLVATPRNASIAGVTAHAAITEQILAGHFLERPDWSLGLELVLVILLGGGLSWALPKLGAIKGAIAAVVGILAVSIGSYLAFTQARFLIDPTYPAMALVLVYTLQTFAMFYREERQRSYIHSAFDRFLSPELVREIAKDPSKLELGGEERDMSVMMCDVRGFTRISEQYSPNEVIQFLIEFLTPMSAILLDNRATIDKYIGDAILAFWNAPLDDRDHHRNAAIAALQIVDQLALLNHAKPSENGAIWPGEVEIGIGLNSGLCCVGNMGSKQRLDYSLIGDVVNVAARLEGLTKQYHVPIITGPDLAENLTDFAIFELDRVRVIGRNTAHSIFALIGDQDVASAQEFTDLKSTHAAVLNAYRGQEWQSALDILTANKQHYTKLKLTSLCMLFIDRITALKASPPTNETDKDWDGVFEATQK